MFKPFRLGLILFFGLLLSFTWQADSLLGLNLGGRVGAKSAACSVGPCLCASMNMAGQPASALPGNWQTRFFYNGALLVTENFTISANPNVAVSDHRITGNTPANDCTPPPLKTNFAPTDQTV